MNSYLNQKEFHWIHAPLVTSVNTPQTVSTTPVQQASLVDQSSDLPTLPNKNNASLEEQLKQQQLLIDKLKLQSRKQSITCSSKKQMIWKPTLEDLV